MYSLHIIEMSRRDLQVEYLKNQDSDIDDGKKCLVISKDLKYLKKSKP